MKKKWIPLLVCLVTALSFSLAGCGGNSLSKISVSGKQDTTYTVYSQGGNAVQYGNYIYFINGNAGYEDADGKQNDWPDVVKGGLYRAELNGAREKDQNGNETGNFLPAKNPDAVTDGLEFMRRDGTDANGNATDIVNVQRIAPKRIGTSGYADGGIFIYDDWVYFASPNNEKNKSGTVQITKTDFFRVKLDGSKAERVYTTKNANNESSPYAFYKYDGAVYLVAQDGTDLISMRLGKKAGKKVTIAQNVASVLLPYADTYYQGMNENTLDHFVYVLRAVGEDDTQNTGNVIEIMRPDGKSGGVFHAQGKSDTLEAVRDGLLFYRTSNATDTRIMYDSLHDFLMGNDEYVDENGKTVKACSVFGDKAYREYQLGLAETERRTQLSGKVLSVPTASAADLTKTYCFRPGGEKSDLVYMLGVKSGSVGLYSNLSEDVITVYSAGATLLNVAKEYMYFTESEGSVIYRTRWDKPASDKGDSGEYLLKEQVSHDDASSANFNGDYCAGYIVYTGAIDGMASSYTFFKQVERNVGSEPVFVGAKISDDVLGAPKITLKGREIKWSAVTGAESYSVYYRGENGVATLEAKDITETTYTVSDSQYGEYWVVAVNSTNSVSSLPSNTVRYSA